MSKKPIRKFNRYSDRRELILNRRRQFMPAFEKAKPAETFMQLLRHKVLILKARLLHQRLGARSPTTPN